MRALVVGGTGPTGPYLVNGLLARGYATAILHRGTHEIDEIPRSTSSTSTPIPTTPPRSRRRSRGAASTSWWRPTAACARSRARASGETDRFVGVGGVPLYRGWMRPEDLVPRGLAVPVREDAPQVESEDELRKGFMIRRTEEAVFEHHPRAAMFRYPIAYGPRQLLPLDWCIVRRVLDGRRAIVLADGGLTLATAGYVENLAHAVLLAVDRPDAAAGQSYNCGDEQTLTLRQRVESIARILGQPLEIVGVPAEVALPAWPMLTHEASDHRVMDLAKIQRELGYRDACRRRRRCGAPCTGWSPTGRSPAASPSSCSATRSTTPRRISLIAAARDALERMRAVRYAQPADGRARRTSRWRTARRGGA